MNVLEAEDIHKHFREGRRTVPVLHGISLSLQRGEVVTLEGPSGSGKTTLLSILGCILTPSAGRLRLAGQEVPMAKPERLAAIRRRSVGFVFQQFLLFPALTALENVEYALNIRGDQGPAARAQAAAMLETLGLSARRDFLPRDLSGGQKQRVAIARALIGAPSVVFADEPTANLDYHTGEQILELFARVTRENHCALLIVTHDPKVRRVADRVLHMQDGRLLP